MHHRIILAFLLIVLCVPAALAQSTSELDRMDFSRIRVDELSDRQIIQILERAEEEGMSYNDLERLATARGMRPSEVVKFRTRARRLQNQVRSETRPTGSSSQTRPDQADAADENDPFYLLYRARQAYSDTDPAFADSLIGLDSTFLTILEKARNDLRMQRQLPIFGSKLFANENLTFEPSLNIPTPRAYHLGPGDELVIDVWGAADMTYTVPVTANGTIRIENLGPVQVAGLTIEQAKQRIVSRLSQLYAGLNSDRPSEIATYADVTLGKLRSIKVHVIGEVNRPGSYTLPSLSTVFNALYACSGPNDMGTYRRIQVIREGTPVGELDVYDFLTSGQVTPIRLEDQDFIKVDPYLTRVTLQGQVKRPGRYEMRPNETLVELLHFAGGFSDQAFTKQLRIYRNTETERRIVLVEAQDFARQELQNGDSVVVAPILPRFENRVEISGAVHREGEYQLESTRTVYGLIQQAGGLRGDAFWTRGLIYRFRENLEPELISFDVAQLVSDPENQDIHLMRDDVVTIRSRYDLQEPPTVHIEGAVQDEGEYDYWTNMTLKDLILMADGLKDEASVQRVEIARRRPSSMAGDPGQIAEILSVDIDRDLTIDSESSLFRLQPFDRVYVRRSANYVEQQNVVITGEVRFPGAYALRKKDERISDLLTRAGGLTPEAYPNGALLTRSKEGMGRVGIDLTAILAAPGSTQDLRLEKQDSIYVPPRLETVMISGAVYYPVNVRYRDGLDFLEYLSQAGGPTDQADLRRTYVVYANGYVDRVRSSILRTKYPEIQPGSHIYVPARIEEEKMSTQERVMIISAIVSVTSVIATTIFQLTR